MPTHSAVEQRQRSIELERRCLELSLAGATFEDIARQLNMRHWMTAYRLYRRGLRRIPQKAAHEARVAQLERLDRLRLKVWSKFKDVSDTTELGVLVLAALRIETRESHLLGLDAPQKLDVEQVIDVNEQALRQRQQEVLAQLSISARAELLAVLRKEKGIDDNDGVDVTRASNNGKP
jgi:hypothetical protein